MFEHGYPAADPPLQVVAAAAWAAATTCSGGSAFWRSFKKPQKLPTKCSVVVSGVDFQCKDRYESRGSLTKDSCAHAPKRGDHIGTFPTRLREQQMRQWSPRRGQQRGKAYLNNNQRLGGPSGFLVWWKNEVMSVVLFGVGSYLLGADKMLLLPSKCVEFLMMRFGAYEFVRDNWYVAKWTNLENWSYWRSSIGQSKIDFNDGHNCHISNFSGRRVHDFFFSWCVF